MLIITKSFVREVADFMRYLSEADPSVRIQAIMPSTTPISPQSQAIVLRRLYWANHMRAAWFSPWLLQDIQRYRPDILHVFEEFSSLIAFQSVLFNQSQQRDGKCIVYSAENIPGNIHQVFRFPARYVMRHTDLVAVCSASVTPVIRHEGYPNQIEVFPLGVDTRLFRKFPNPQLKYQLGLDGKFVIGYVGRLLAIKGVNLLIAVLRDLPDQIHALIVGTGPERTTLQHVAATNQVAHRVHFVDHVPYAQLPGYINCMDIGIVPSQTSTRWKEQFGRVLIEFMSCEIPVIASNSGAIPEILGSAGYLVSERNRQELSLAINHLYSHPEIRSASGQRGRARVSAFYSFEIMCQRLQTMYHGLSGKTPLVPIDNNLTNYQK